MTLARVVVSGSGCICAAGADAPACLVGMEAGRRAPREPRRIALDVDRPFPVFEVHEDLAGALRGFDFPAPAAEPGRTSRLALAAAAEAIRDAHLDPGDLAGPRVGVCMGTTVGCTLNNEPFYRAWRAGEKPDLGPVEAFLANNPAECLARALGATGPVATIDNACSSGADAIGLALEWLRQGRCDVALAGGADELSRVTCLGFMSLMIVADEPCRPFDRRRKGLNLGEGAGIVVMESAERARHRQASPRAELMAYATRADAHHPTAPHPEARGLRRATDAALKRAGVSPRSVAFVNAHGTSTPDNDRVEARAIAGIFGDTAPVVSTKAYTGHTLGAAGAIEAVLTVRHLAAGRIPPTAGFGESDPDCGMIPTVTATNLDPRRRAAVSNSLAFGGNNSVLVFGRSE